MDEFIRLSNININDRAEEGKRVVNQMKNRYVGLYPYDSTRVKLTLRSGIDGSDYINANYVESFLQKGRFIATQAPLEHTFEDFWRMIWEQNCQTIVMVSKEREKKQVIQSFNLNLLRDLLPISVLILSEFKRTNYFHPSLNSLKNLWCSDDCWGNKINIGN